MVFIGALLFDIVPFPFLPAFTIMVFLQVVFDLNIWLVVIIGVLGSILGRYVFALYIPSLAARIFKPSKTEDFLFLGTKIREQGWRSQLVIVAYTLLPLPTTPLFVAAGIAKIKPLYIIPAFFIGKFITDAITLHIGKYASDNFESIIAVSWGSIPGIVVGILFLSIFLFIDWRSLIQKKIFKLKFKIWK